MNAYLEPTYPVLMNAVASHDKSFGLWLQESTLIYAYGMPVAAGLAVTGLAIIGAKAWQVSARKTPKRNRTPAAYIDAICDKPWGIGAVLAGGLMASALTFSSVGPVRLDEAKVMPTWHKPTAAQVLQAMTTCEYWVAPVGASTRYTCPVDFGSRWEHFTTSTVKGEGGSKLFKRPGPKQVAEIRSVSVQQMEVLTATAQQLSKVFTERGCYMPAHPAAHVWCPNSETSYSLTEWVVQSNPTAWGHKACGYGKTYVHTAQQYLEPSVKESLSAPALVRYVMPSAVSCGGDGIPLEKLGQWISAGIRSYQHKEPLMEGGTESAAVAVAKF